MTTVVDDTIRVLANLGLKASVVPTPRGYVGIEVPLPHDARAFFIWSKSDSIDYFFRVARFWVDENPFNTFVSANLPEAIAQTRVMANS